MLILILHYLFRYLILDLDQFLQIVFKDEIVLLTRLILDQTLVDWPLDNELMLVCSRHDVLGQVSCSFLRRALVQTEDLRHVIERKIILHVILHLMQIIENAGCEVRTGLLVIYLSSIKILLVLSLVNLADREVIEFVGVICLKVPASNTSND